MEWGIHLVPSLGTGPLPLLCELIVQYKEVTIWASFLLFHNQPWTLPDPGPEVLMLQLVSRDLGALGGVPCLWVHVSCPGPYHASSPAPDDRFKEDSGVLGIESESPSQVPGKYPTH